MCSSIVGTCSTIKRKGSMALWVSGGLFRGEPHGRPSAQIMPVTYYAWPRVSRTHTCTCTCCPLVFMIIDTRSMHLRGGSTAPQTVEQALPFSLPYTALLFIVGWGWGAMGKAGELTEASHLIAGIGPGTAYATRLL